jgi:hypothetical protein
VELDFSRLKCRVWRWRGRADFLAGEGAAVAFAPPSRRLSLGALNKTSASKISSESEGGCCQVVPI